MPRKYEAIVVGTGFGGAVAACRLAKLFGNNVLVLERGKRYQLGSFPRTPQEIADSFWDSTYERRVRPDTAKRATDTKDANTGLFDVRDYNSVDVLLAAGLGGGSLIYANVFMEPPEDVFAYPWPETCRNGQLKKYYSVCKEVLGAQPIPRQDASVESQDRRRIIRTDLFQDFARRAKRSMKLVDIAVFFGADYADNSSAKPLPLGHQERNRYGALQTSCTYCAECDIGCNCHAKNTLDLNYLHKAEEYGADIRTEHSCIKIVPVDKNGAEDIDGDGEHGYRVDYRPLPNGKVIRALTQRVVLAAGALGSTELLLRCRDKYKTLKRVSGKLGHNMSANGDFLGVVVGTKSHTDPNRGPVITQRIDFNLFEGFNSEHAFILEDAAYPNFSSWFVEGVKPRFYHFDSLIRFFQSLRARARGRDLGPIGHAFRELLRDDIASRSCILLFMGIDSSNGTMTLGPDGWLNIDWPQSDNCELYEQMTRVGNRFAEKNNALFFSMPTYWWPHRNNVTVHPLGGCALSDHPDKGVTSGEPKTFGQVHGYENLYVADGAIIPSAVGANPSATIAALSEMIAHSIEQSVNEDAPMPTATL